MYRKIMDNGKIKASNHVLSRRIRVK